MKRAAASILALAFVFSFTELHEIMKLPVLVQHYFSHHRKDPSLSLAAFLNLHYSTHHPEDNDDQDDASLPFKAGIETVASVHLGLPVTHSSSCYNLPAACNFIVPVKQGALQEKSYAIFHPPRPA